jgi:hypothetical protein
MNKLTLPVMIGEFRLTIEIDQENSHNAVAWIGEVIDMVNHLTSNHPEIKPQPTFQNQKAKTPDMPFSGTITKRETVPAKDGKKEYHLAYVEPKEGGELVSVRYYGPMKTWQDGEQVKVIKGNYGPELKEIDEATPF